MSQRTVEQVRQWYKTHDSTATLGYNPDGRCLQICREARNIDAMYPSALSAQQATPAENRIHRISAIKPGHVGYYDDSDDGNPYGHIVTYVARDKSRDPNTLGSLWCRTNSVKSGRVVVVRGDYFSKFWRDPFIFAADHLNGEDLIMPRKKKPKPPLGEGRVRRMRHAVAMLGDLIDKTSADPGLNEKQKARLIRALRRDRNELLETIERFDGK